MKENRIIVITMIFNIVVAVLKLVAGIIFSFSTLLADSIQSFMDVITDVTSLIANKVGKRRANKTYPFGYGQVYYLANLFTGFLLFLIGIVILYQFFTFEGTVKTNEILFAVLIIVLLLKLVVVKMLKFHGKKFKSELMIEASKESCADFISTCVVILVFILTILEKHMPININIDKIGSLGMAIYVFYVSIKMMIQNIKGMLTNDEENTEIKEEIANELSKFKNIEIKGIKTIRMSTYYSVFIQVKMDDNMTIRRYLLLEKRIKAYLKSKNKLFRFIDIEPV